MSIESVELFDIDATSPSDPKFLAWLEDHRQKHLDFYQGGAIRPEGGIAWLDDQGQPLREKGAQQWVGARMIHVFSLASMLGRPGADEVVEHGLDFYVDGPGHDDQFGGWFPVVGGDEPADAKELYGIAHMLLAGSSATQAGFSRGPEMMNEALNIIDRYYWDDELGRGVESYDRAFATLDSYRGQNANMHLTEAFLAAYEATGNRLYLERATRIAKFVAGRAVLSDPEVDAPWRLPEHFDSDWTPVPDHNIDDKAHPFRPYGTQVGHWLEWAKLCTQIHDFGVDEPWLIPTAELLFQKAIEEGWAENGGFAYTLDWDGNPVVPERYFWTVAEGIGAAHALFQATGNEYYLDWYKTLWQFAHDNFVDEEYGSWYSELDEANQPTAITWTGKPDPYHVFQATLYPLMPQGVGLAQWAHDQKAARNPQ